MVGRVVSVKMQNTAVVIVERRKTHPLYKKSFLRTKKYLVDDQFSVKLGDVVIFEKCAPISKMKHFRITKVLGQDIVSLEQAQLQEKAEEAIAEVMPVEEEDQIKSDKSENQSVSGSENSDTPATTDAPKSDSSQASLISSDLSEKPKKTRAKKGSK